MRTRLTVLAMGLLAGALMGGCELTCNTEPKGPAEKIGESIDRAVDAVKDEAKKDIKVEVKTKP